MLHVTEVGERAFAEELMQRQSEILELIARGTPLEEILERLVGAMERLAPGMIGSVLLLEGGRMRHGAAPRLPAETLRAIDGLASDPLWKDLRDVALRDEPKACWSAPILSRKGKVLGAFAMYYRNPRAPAARDMHIVRAATQLASIAIERDLSDRALVESEARLQAILNHASAAVFVKDLAGRHLLVNRTFERNTGLPAAAVQGKTDYELFPRAVAEALARNDRQVAETCLPIAIEEELPAADGPHTYLSAKFPLLDGAGRVQAIGAIATDITERKRAERELTVSREELRALSQQLQQVREQERARISREIHDELGQLLTGLNMNQGLLLRDLRSGALPPEQAIAQLESMQELVRRLMGSVRRIATELRPEVLDALGIAAALEWQASEFTRRTGIGCEVRLAEGSQQLDAQRSTALFRIFQEALSNAARHSGATRVIAQLRRNADSVVLIVADNGRGIAHDAGRDAPALGLLGMRERAAMLGGEVKTEGRPGHGTTVSVRLPL